MTQQVTDTDTERGARGNRKDLRRLKQILEREAVRSNG
jgi:hypothetical protein